MQNLAEATVAVQCDAAEGLYIAGYPVGEKLARIIGLARGRNALQATLRAQERWPGCGTIPYDAATDRQRATARAADAAGKVLELGGVAG
jgi:hypothetical protein